MIEYIGVSGAYAPPLHIGPPTCDERAEARRLAREAFVHAYAADEDVARGENKKHDLDTARERAETLRDAQAGGKVPEPSPAGPVYTPAENAVPFLAQLIAQEIFPEDTAPVMRRAAEASGHYNAVPTSRVSFDGPQAAFSILA